MECGPTTLAGKRLKPDLSVMGGYGHSRLREYCWAAQPTRFCTTPAPLLTAH
jgi:hypothetical protein